MTLPTPAMRRKPEAKIEFHVERRPQLLRVAIRGEASFDQAEVLQQRVHHPPPATTEQGLARQRLKWL